MCVTHPEVGAEDETLLLFVVVPVESEAVVVGRVVSRVVDRVVGSRNKHLVLGHADDRDRQVVAQQEHDERAERGEQGDDRFLKDDRLLRRLGLDRGLPQELVHRERLVVGVSQFVAGLLLLVGVVRSHFAFGATVGVRTRTQRTEEQRTEA